MGGSENMPSAVLGLALGLGLSMMRVGGQRTGVGAIEHARQVGARGGVHEFLLRRLLHDAIRRLYGMKGHQILRWMLEKPN